MRFSYLKENNNKKKIPRSKVLRMLSDMKDIGQKSYEKFIDIYRMAHPQLNKEIQLRKGQELWKKIKNDAEEYVKTVMTLNATAANSTSRDS